MDRLSPIDEDDKDPSGRSAPYESLPTVTPMLRTFEETTQRQNAECQILYVEYQYLYTLALLS